MNLFETVKSAVTVKQAAEHYGCKVNRGDMICCPFHDDRHPSMKLNRDYFYCFSCGATGDVIDFVARLFVHTPLKKCSLTADDGALSPLKWCAHSAEMVHGGRERGAPGRHAGGITRGCLCACAWIHPRSG